MKRWEHIHTNGRFCHGVGGEEVCMHVVYVWPFPKHTTAYVS
ncbi:hypothetical protein LINGRAHAP2_LOCUS31597 [Linum grandiflorum]